MDIDFTQKSSPSLMSPNELAIFLGISKATVYRLIEKRLITFYKVGHSLKFKKDDIEDYLENNRVKSAKELL